MKRLDQAEKGWLVGGALLIGYDILLAKRGHRTLTGAVRAHPLLALSVGGVLAGHFLGRLGPADPFYVAGRLTDLRQAFGSGTGYR